MYFEQKTESMTTAVSVIEEQKQREAEDHAHCMKENDLWNAAVAKLREERLAKEAQQTHEKIMNALIEHERNQQQLLDELNASVREEKEKYKNFITPENLDEAIEKALANPVDHNFAIDAEGNIWFGRHGRPDITPLQQQSDNTTKI